MLNNKEPGLDNIRKAGDTLKREVKPISDIRGSAEYRREISAALLLTAFQNLGYVLDAEKAQ
jgi:CO/xanthine dehydrogenase FAD-binding subunit